MLFSFQGRISCSTYRRAVIWISIFIIVLIYCFNYIAGFENTKAYDINRLILLLLIISSTIYSSVAVHVKRCHDIGRSGWFVMLYLIPIVNIWAAHVLWWYEGIHGRNEYGPDPLNKVMLS